MAVPHGFLEVGNGMKFASRCIHCLVYFYRLFKVIDSLLLFCNSHKNESNDICLWISLTLNDAETRIATNRFLSLDFKGSFQSTYSDHNSHFEQYISVRVGGLGAYYTNGTSFLQNLR